MARLPEGALMQRAAHGLAYAVLDLLGSAYGRRVLLLVGSGDNGGDALYAGAVLARRGVAVEAWLLTERAHEAGLAALRRAGGRRASIGVGRRPRPGRRRHRRHRRPTRAPARGPARPGGARGRPRRGRRHPVGRRRRHRRARRPARHGGRHGHVRHPQGRAPGRPRRVGRGRRAPGRHRPRPAARGGRGAAARRRRGAAAATRYRRPEVHPRRGRGPRRLERVPRRRSAQRRRSRLRARRHGPLRRRRRGRDRVRADAPRGRRRRPGAGLGGRIGSGEGAEAPSTLRWPTASRWSSTPTR